LTKAYGVETIVGETTASSVPGQVFRELDKVRVKGKLEPITIFEPMGAVENVTSQQQQMLTLLEQGLELYRQQNWDQAKAIFDQLAADSDDKLYQIYLERIEFFQDLPPAEDWDGVFVYEIK